MSDSVNSKPVPRSVLVFGASAHIGAPLVRFLHREAPRVRLRVATARLQGVDALRQEFPYAEAVHASYFDPASLDSAVRGMEGVFVITPFGMDEGPAMTNLVAALRKAGSAVHVLRTLGLQPEANLRRLPPFVRKARLGLPVQHPIAKRILDESDLPVTYLNIGAAFMDNFLWMTEDLRRERRLVWHDRLIPFIDPRDIGEVAGRLFLSDNHRHIGQFHTLNNGHDLMRYSDVVELMSEVFGEKITLDSSRESFVESQSGRMGEAAAVLWEFLEYERENEVVWARNDFVERTLGRKPLALREWLQEHADLLLK